jgi:hypothetical protein
MTLCLRATGGASAGSPGPLSATLVADQLPAPLRDRSGTRDVVTRDVVTRGGSALEARGAVPADDLGPWQARRLLALVLAGAGTEDAAALLRRCVAVRASARHQHLRTSSAAVPRTGR